ncbi:MAG TPA: hypothetical protein VNO50_10795 [Pyrinomonadaceae bacterium]|nr:hypothetical protein [Pyrinomonadaceae bacterium]
MAKEHAGGHLPPGVFRVPVEWSEDKAQAIQIEVFDFEHLDSLEDQVREHMAAGKPVSDLVKRLARLWMCKEKEEIISKLLSVIIQSKKPGLAATQLAFAAGLYVTASVTGPELAKKHGISKEAFQQGVERLREELGLRQTRTMRDQKARDTMRQTNYRPGKLKAA